MAQPLTARTARADTPPAAAAPRAVWPRTGSRRAAALRTAVLTAVVLLVAVVVAASCGGGGTQAVVSKDAPEAIGPYSQAVRSGDLLFLSGQIAIDPATGELVGGSVGVQTQQALKNLKAVLVADGLTLDDVVSTTVYLADLDDFEAMNQAYDGFFGDTPPARATVEVARLPRDAAVEISAVAAATQ